jgi:hypothetical protein
MLTEIFLTFLCTSTIGCFLAVVNSCYKSKCSEVKLCCFTIKRDVTIEKDEDLEMMKKQNNNDIK